MEKLLLVLLAALSVGTQSLPPSRLPPPRSPFACCSGQASCGGATNDPVTCAALGDLYYAANGGAWANSGGWSAAAAGTPSDLCTFWQRGVSPCAGGVLTYLNLRLNALSGSIPASLGSLASLTGFDIGSNSLSGTVSAALGSLANLQHLYLAGSGLCGADPIPFNNCVPSDGPLPSCPSPPLPPPPPAPSPQINLLGQWQCKVSGSFTGGGSSSLTWVWAPGTNRPNATFTPVGLNAWSALFPDDRAYSAAALNASFVFFDYNVNNYWARSPCTPPPPPTSPPSQSPAHNLTCATGSENSAVTLACPGSLVISAILFARFEAVSNFTTLCGNYTSGSSSCGGTVTASVASLCAGKASCTLSASNSVFGDTCPGHVKSLRVEAACAELVSPPPTPSPPRPRSPNPSPAPLPSSSSAGGDGLSFSWLLDLVASCQDLPILYQACILLGMVIVVIYTALHIRRMYMYRTRDEQSMQSNILLESAGARWSATAAATAHPASLPPRRSNPWSLELVNVAVTPESTPLSEEEMAVDPEDACVICMVAIKSELLIHGSSAHLAACGSCAPLLLGRPCPLCRAPVERLISKSSVFT